MTFAILGAALPAVILYGLRDSTRSRGTARRTAGSSAPARSPRSPRPRCSRSAARADHDARAVIAGGAFSTMATLLAVHGLATPGVLVGSNGVVALSGGVTIPVGAALLALLGVPSLADPRRIRTILQHPARHDGRDLRRQRARARVPLARAERAGTQELLGDPPAGRRRRAARARRAARRSHLRAQPPRRATWRSSSASGGSRSPCSPRC